MFIYSLLKQNIKSFIAKRRAATKTAKKISWSVMRRKITLHVQYTLLYIIRCLYFAQPLPETFRNFLVTRFMEERL